MKPHDLKQPREKSIYFSLQFYSTVNYQKKSEQEFRQARTNAEFMEECCLRARIRALLSHRSQDH